MWNVKHATVIDDIFKYILVYTFSREFIVSGPKSSSYFIDIVFAGWLRNIFASKFLFEHNAVRWCHGICFIVSHSQQMVGNVSLEFFFFLSSRRTVKREPRLVEKKYREWNKKDVTMFGEDRK